MPLLQTTQCTVDEIILGRRISSNKTYQLYEAKKRTDERLPNLSRFSFDESDTEEPSQAFPFLVKITDLNGHSTNELKILSSISHPNIVRFQGWAQNDRSLYLLLERGNGASLADLRERKKQLTEDESKPLFRQLLQVVTFLHGKGIAHLNLKLETVFLHRPLLIGQSSVFGSSSSFSSPLASLSVSPTDYLLSSSPPKRLLCQNCRNYPSDICFFCSTLKLSDFQYAKQFHKPTRLTSSQTNLFLADEDDEVEQDDDDELDLPLSPKEGVSPTHSSSSVSSNLFDPSRLAYSPHNHPYSSPEFQRQSFKGPEVDLWAVGVLLYTLVFGHFPFSPSHSLSADQISSDLALSFPQPVSPDLKNLLSQLLASDPSGRSNASELLSHPWFEATVPSSPKTPVSPSKLRNSGTHMNGQVNPNLKRNLNNYYNSNGNGFASGFNSNGFHSYGHSSLSNSLKSSGKKLLNSSSDGKIPLSISDSLSEEYSSVFLQCSRGDDE